MASFVITYRLKFSAWYFTLQILLFLRLDETAFAEKYFSWLVNTKKTVFKLNGRKYPFEHPANCICGAAVNGVCLCHKPESLT